MVTSVPWQLASTASEGPGPARQGAAAARSRAAPGPATRAGRQRNKRPTRQPADATATAGTNGHRSDRRVRERPRDRAGRLDGAVLELDVGPVAHGGHCVARADDGPGRLRPPCAAGRAGPRAGHRAAQAFLRADAVEVLEPSPDRVHAAVPVGRPGPLRRLRPPARVAGRAAGAEGRRRARAARPAGRAEPGRGRRPGRTGAGAARREPTVWAGAPGCSTQWTPPAGPGCSSTARTRWCRWTGASSPIRRSSARAGASTGSWPDADAVEVVASAAGEVDRAGPARAGPAGAVSGPGTVRRAGRRVGTGASRRRRSGRCTRPPPTRWPRPSWSCSDPRPGSGPGTSTAAPGCSPRRWPRASDRAGRVTRGRGRRRPRRAAARRNLARPDHRRPWSRPTWSGRCADAAPAPVDLVVLDPPRAGAGAAVVAAIVGAGGRGRWPTSPVTRPRSPGTCAPSARRAGGWPHCAAYRPASR